jgi:hypothetical protein
MAGASNVVMAQSFCTAQQTSHLFSYTGAEQTLVIPAGVTNATVLIEGAQGGSGGGPLAGLGGQGSVVEGSLVVTPGSTLYVYVGGQGTVFNGAALGGNVAGGIGGGASDIRVGGNAVVNRVAVAGGGGGGGSTGCNNVAGTDYAGGAGGNGSGGAGTAGTNSASGGGGAGGLSGIGGAAGVGCASFLGAPGQASGVGGDGQTCCCFGNPRTPGGGGGGGGAVVGGGGGGGSAGTTGCSGNDKGAGGGGGGGTTAAPGLTATTIINGTVNGNGLVEICLAMAPLAPNVAVPTVSDSMLPFLAILLLAIGMGVFARSRRT